MVMPYHLHMPSYFLETFTEYPFPIPLQPCLPCYEGGAVTFFPHILLYSKSFCNFAPHFIKYKFMNGEKLTPITNKPSLGHSVHCWYFYACIW